jgi:hypothetical protein
MSQRAMSVNYCIPMKPDWWMMLIVCGGGVTLAVRIDVILM